ncbi:MAG: 1-acyl-sn-glycerol-3-phosphate acyltransferase [Prevotellaceae bacterium]|jgi:1-acyl-sn-glycerol-3-phosphate acyltransferase|nr:1-acyl-sn-glycerol-3-phosphate acyltransferase [Prevotellaceae bacterium]
MVRFFVDIYGYFCSRRALLFGLLAVLVAGMLFVASRVKYKEDIADFVPDSKATGQINAVYRQVGSSDKLMVSFSMRDSTLSDAERLMAAIDTFAVLLGERDSLHAIPEVVAQVDESRMAEVVEFIRQNVPYFLTEADYRRMDTLLSEDFVALQLRESKRLLTLPAGSLLRESVAADPLHLFSPLLLKLKDFQAGDRHELVDGYLFSAGGRKGMVMLTSPYGVSETDGNTALLRMVDETMRSVEAAFPDVKVTCFGAPAIAVTNASQIKKDSALASWLAVALILLLLLYFFRSGRSVVLIFASVAFGWLFALSLLSVFRDSISIIAVGVSSVFIGIAVNYPLHLIDHLRQQRDARQALREIIPPLLIGNITTVGAFLSLVFLSSDAMRDLGLFGSLLLVGAMLFVLIFLPHIVKPRAASLRTARLPFERVASFAPETKRWIVWAALLLTCPLLYLSRSTTFEADMNKISYMTGQQREDMRDMLQSVEQEDREIIYLVSEGAQLNDALAAHEHNVPLLDTLRQAGLVERVSGVGVFLASTEEQQLRVERWNRFWGARREATLRQLEQAGSREGFREGSFAPFAQLLRADFAPQDAGYFAPLASLLAGSYVVQGKDGSMVVSLLYCRKDSAAALMQAVSRAADGTFAFNARSAGQRIVDSLSGDFTYVLYVCGFIVFIFLTLSFGRVELSLLAFLPLAVSWVWILGLMQLGDMRFNIVNIILATFIFGQGDDYTIFITEGLMYEYAYRRKALKSYKNSIILSALIMFAGVGTLIFAKHPAMRSLAEVTVVGMFSVVIMSYLIPPLIFRWLTQAKSGLRKTPLTIGQLAASVYVGAVFLSGCVALTAAGFALFCFGKKSERRKLRYHSLLCQTARFVIRRVPGVKLRYQNLSGETFQKPAIIISNHQSHLDLMCLMMLTPRLIILTNEWVWSNPFYGQLIRYADFYPVTGGIERGVAPLSEMVRRGYSIVVFPEGTRSEDCSIRRFHRGAFFLAEALTLDIVPVVLHGAGHVLPKKDLMLHGGAITVQVHPRIAPGDTRYGDTYAARAKQVRQCYLKTFEALARQLETATYFGDFVRRCYLYKGAAVERSVRRELKRTGCYARWIDRHSGTGAALVVNSGYGAFAFLFALVHKRAQVVAVDGDDNRVALARGCAALPANLTVCGEAELPSGVTFETIFLLNPSELQRRKYGAGSSQIIIVQ